MERELTPREKTRRIVIGGVPVGGGAPVSVQSMTKTDTRDVSATLEQIDSLARVGCEIVRVAIPDEEALRAFREIKRSSPLPVVADIHFHYRLAVGAIEAGADCVRINPGNIGDRWKVEEVIRAARGRGIPVRIGVNAGSLERDILEAYGKPSAEALVESARRHVEFFEERDFRDIKVSLKASDVVTTVRAYELFSSKYPYPLHVGITEAGTVRSGTVRSAVGIGIILHEGIGDTIRVSLTGPPEEEVRVGFEILRSLGLRRRGVEIISCPTCGRIEVDILPIVEEVERRLGEVRESLTVAVMGCVVNGPGEAREADVGVACGKGVGLIFRRGEIIKKVREWEIVDELVGEVFDLIRESREGG
ncbi:MAG: flavodoxin-dependent (E)-4-hydroxy-3-methylbut-2-enyl-diphosphate synthase [Deltaproteobacteria bacterium]|nr:MAG: flavodoxin-dependent (E)-4-hydroxy-3-methylbut-2-enyl-diphosphate synthase [Deltaproteobacteria bacterium]